MVHKDAPCINLKMVLEYNSQKPLNTSNGFGVQLTETGP